MAVTLASLRARYPEFTAAPDALLTSCITAAGYEVNGNVWGDLEDEGVMLLACDKAARAAYGMPLQEQPGGSTNYYFEYLRLARLVGSCYRVPW